MASNIGCAWQFCWRTPAMCGLKFAQSAQSVESVRGMAKTNLIELPGCEPIPILYEDRSVLAVDKPRGWMLAPASWRNTSRNLQAAMESSVAAGDFWARTRNLKFLRYV